VADTQVSDWVWAVDGSTATEIARLQSAIARMLVDIDVLLTKRVDVEFLSATQMAAHGDKVPGGGAAWGVYHAGYNPRRRIHLLDSLNSERMQRSLVHELAHASDDDVLNHAKRVSLMAIMDPAADGWNAGSYVNHASEAFADTYPHAYADFTIVPYDYGRVVPASQYATFRGIVQGAGAPASTTLAAAVLAGATNIKVVSVTGLTAGDWIQIGTGTTDERKVVTVGTAGSGGTGLTLETGLTNGYASGVAVVEIAPPPPPSSGEIRRVVTTNTPNNQLSSHLFTELSRGAKGSAYVRYWDGNAWGEWSDPTAVALVVAPGKPTNLVPGSPLGAHRGLIETLTPTFGATIDRTNDPAAAITEYLIRVYQQIPGGTNISKMIAGDTVTGGPNRVTVAYSGNEGGPLAWDQPYVWTIRLRNQHGIWSPDADWHYFKPTAVVGPVITPNDPAVKIDSLTPSFTLAHRSGTNIDQARLKILANDKTTVLYDSLNVGVSPVAASKAIAVPANILAWGMDIWVTGSVRVSGEGNHGSDAEPYQMHVNAQPGSPAPISVSHATEQVVVVDNQHWVTTSPDPDITLPFRDVDRDNGFTAEYPKSREVEIADAAGVLIARIIRLLYALDDHVETTSIGSIMPFDQPAALTPAQSGWVAGTAAALSYDTVTKAEGASSLKIALTNLATATTSTQTRANSLVRTPFYADLAAVTTFKIKVRRSAGPAGLTVKLRFTFLGNASNFAEFDITPSANNVTEEKSLTRTAPGSTGGTVNWAGVSGVEIRVSHTAGSNQSFNIWVDALSLVYATIEQWRRIRALYSDSADVTSAYSAAAWVKYSAAPTLSGVTPADGAVVTDPTPAVGWTMASSGGKTQAGYRFIARVGDEDVYDTDYVPSTATSLTVPVGEIQNGQTVNWSLYVYDTDGLYAVRHRTFTTAFTAPVALTGLVITVDDDAKALLLTWDASTLSADEFLAYIVYAKAPGGQFELVATLLDKDAPSFLYKAAAHNAETVIRVTQSNGFAESEALEGTATLEAAGYAWLSRPDVVMELGVDKRSHNETPIVDQEVHTPVGPYDRIVLTWGHHGFDGRMSVIVSSAERDQLEAFARAGEVVLLKFEDGRARYCVLTLSAATYVEEDSYQIDVAYKSVSGATAGF
jgi:hypothetical protein